MESTCISYFTHCYDNMPGENDLSKEKVYLGWQFEGIVHSGEKGVSAGVQHSGSCCNHSQEAEGDECCCSPHFLLFIQCKTWTHGMMAPLFRVDLPTSIPTSIPSLESPLQRCVSIVTLNPNNLTIEIHCHGTPWNIWPYAFCSPFLSPVKNVYPEPSLCKQMFNIFIWARIGGDGGNSIF